MDELSGGYGDLWSGHISGQFCDNVPRVHERLERASVCCRRCCGDRFIFFALFFLLSADHLYAHHICCDGNRGGVDKEEERIYAGVGRGDLVATLRGVYIQFLVGFCRCYKFGTGGYTYGGLFYINI